MSRFTLIAPWLPALSFLQTGAGARDTGLDGLPPAPVTPAVVDARTTKAVSDP